MVEHEHYNIRAIIKFFFSEDSIETHLKYDEDLYFVFSETSVHYFTDQDMVHHSYSKDLLNKRSLSTNHPLFNEEIPNYRKLIQQGYDHLRFTQIIQSKFQIFNDHHFNLSIIDHRSFLSLERMPSLAELLGTGFIMRLSPFNPLLLLESDHQRLIQIVESSHDLLILVENQSDLISLASWVSQYTRTLEYPLYAKQQSLPRSWHWLFLNQPLSSARLGHWQVPNIYIQHCSNLDVFLHYHQTTAPQLQTILSLSATGRIQLNTLTTRGWETEFLFNKIQKAPVEHKENQKERQDHSQDPSHPENEQQAYVLNYEEVMSGLGSETSTLQVSMDHMANISNPITASISKSPFFQDPPAPIIAEAKHIQSLPTEAIESDTPKGQSSEINSVQSGANLSESNPNDQGLSQSQKVQPSVHHLAIQDHFDEIDQSEVVEISLSELPISPSEIQDELNTSNHFEYSSFEEVQSVLNQAQSLAINRSIAPPKNKPSSMVTMGNLYSSQEEQITTNQSITYELPQIDDFPSHLGSSNDGDFDYQTLNQVHLKSHSTLKPLVEDKYLETADFELVDQHKSDVHSSITDRLDQSSFDFDDVDSLPTRVDIDSSQVIKALEDERKDAVTRIAEQEDQTMTQSHNTVDPINNDQNKTEVAPIQNQPSGSSTIDREALSRENTAKLKIRDFDMLTDIKERPQPSPQPPPQSGQMSAPPLSQSPPVAHTLPFASNPINQQEARNTPQISNARLNEKASSTANQKATNRSHKDRRSFSDVIRSLTNKHKP